MPRPPKVSTTPKEFLVEKVKDGPGVHAGRALLDEEPLEGLWFDRT